MNLWQIDIKAVVFCGFFKNGGKKKSSESLITAQFPQVGAINLSGPLRVTDWRFTSSFLKPAMALRVATSAVRIASSTQQKSVSNKKKVSGLRQLETRRKRRQIFSLSQANMHKQESFYWKEWEGVHLLTHHTWFVSSHCNSSQTGKKSNQSHM